MADRALQDSEIESIVSQQIELAKSHDKAARANDRAKALDYYLGQMDSYVPPEPNRSKVVSRDVADTITKMLPGIMRVFLASDHMAVADPEPPTEDDYAVMAKKMLGEYAQKMMAMQAKMQGQPPAPGQPPPKPPPPPSPEEIYQAVIDHKKDVASDATQGLNFVFFHDNDGETVVYDATWDALLVGNGVVKVYYDDTPVYKTSFHSDLSDDQVAQLLEKDEDGDEPEVLAHTEHAETLPADPLNPKAPTSRTSHDLKIKRKLRDGSFVIDAIPPEEFLIDADAVTTEEAAFTDHWTKKARSALVAMGYDKAKIWAIPQATKVSTSEASARDKASNTAESTDKSMELVDYHECFMRVDVDGDGEAELIRVCYGGAETGSLLDWEVWEDENPFADIKCEPIPHRWIARSVADETIDIQDIKTVLNRQMLNNTYWVSNPMRFAKGSIKNPEMLDSPVFGGTVFGGPEAEVGDLPVPYVGDKILAAIGLADQVLQSRTGVGRQSLALDPDTLQNQSATAANLEHDAQYSQTEQVARNMAAGWKKVFRKLLKLMVQHQDYARTVMSNGKPVQIDPRQWNADMNVSINVGLGTGSRDRDLMMLQHVLNNQFALAKMFLEQGATQQAIDLLPKIIETMTKMAEASGIKNPEEFFPEYDQQTLAQLKQMAMMKAQQPDPKVQATLEKAKADAAVKQQAAQQDAALQGQKQQGDLALKKYQIDAEIGLRQQQMNAELQLKEQEMVIDSAHRAADRQASSQVHLGGQPG